MGVQSTRIDNGYLTGVVHDNKANRDRSGSGFNPLNHILYPGQNLFRDDAVGLNFEHIMNEGRKRAASIPFSNGLRLLMRYGTDRAAKQRQSIRCSRPLPPTRCPNGPIAKL